MTKLKKEFMVEANFTKQYTGTQEEWEKASESDMYISRDWSNSSETQEVKYKMINENISHEQIVEEALFSINKKAKITMYCALFFVVLTLISMITTFVFTYKISKVTEVFDGIYSYDTDYDYWD